MEKRTITLSQFARQIGVTYQTVLKWVLKGQLKVIKLPSGRYRLPQSEVSKFIEIQDESEEDQNAN